MRISNENQLLYFRIFFLLLAAISIFDFLEHQSIIQTGLPVWGQLYLVSIALSVFLLATMGRPGFTIDTQLDIIEIYSGLAFIPFFERFRIINIRDFQGYEIKRSFMNTKLVVFFNEEGEACFDEFSITYLSDAQISEIEKDLKSSLGKAQSGNLLFV